MTWILRDKDERIINVINDGQYPLKLTNKTTDKIYYLKTHTHKASLWLNSTEDKNDK